MKIAADGMIIGSIAKNIPIKSLNGFEIIVENFDKF